MKFYKTFTKSECSSFCEYVIEYVANREVRRVLDAGCGNGRDTYRLADWYDVTGIDTSSHIPENKNGCEFKEIDFCTHNKDTYELIYSRFTFHSITNEQHKLFLSSIKNKDTILCIECRSDKDRDAEKIYGEDHYRNYINYTYIVELVKMYDFHIEYIEEARGFSVHNTEDPWCIRLIARKN